MRRPGSILAGSAAAAGEKVARRLEAQRYTAIEAGAAGGEVTAFKYWQCSPIAKAIEEVISPEYAGVVASMARKSKSARQPMLSEAGSALPA